MNHHHQEDDCETKTTTFVMPKAVHTQLKAWAKQNRTSMIAELIRATRERAERDAEKKAVA